MTFSSDLRRIAKKTNRKLDDMVRFVAVESLDSVVRLSPVDTGRFRGNWQLTKNFPASGTLDVTDTSGRATVNKGKAVASSVDAGDSAYIVNNLPYAQRLENGWSQQAPQGMVKRTVRRLGRNIRKEAARLNRK